MKLTNFRDNLDEREYDIKDSFNIYRFKLFYERKTILKNDYHV